MEKMFNWVVGQDKAKDLRILLHQGLRERQRLHADVSRRDMPPDGHQERVEGEDPALVPVTQAAWTVRRGAHSLQGSD